MAGGCGCGRALRFRSVILARPRGCGKAGFEEPHSGACCFAHAGSRAALHAAPSFATLPHGPCDARRPVTRSFPGADAAALGRCLLLKGLEPKVVADLLTQGVRVRTVLPRHVIFERGSPGEAVFLLLPQAAGATQPGLVALRAGHPERGAPVLAGLVREGDAFGVIEPLRRLMDGQPQTRALEARALTRVRIAEVPWPMLQALVARQPKVQLRLAGHLAERAVTLADALHDAATQRLDARLARLLCELLPLFGPRQRGGQVVTQADLAAALGARREPVSLALAQWRRAGVLDLAPGRGIAVMDPDRLRRIAAGLGAAGGDRAVRDALDAGRAFRARNLALDILPLRNGPLGLQHLAVLACIRAGAGEEARVLLRRFGFQHGGDVAGLARRTGLSRTLDEERDALLEDIAALEPRLAKDAAFDLPAGEARATAMRGAAEAYARVFAATEGAYPGINAASLLAMAGDHPRAAAAARRVLDRLPAQPKAYYDLATRAEADLLAGQAEAAASWLRQAAAAPDATSGARGTTRRQLHRLAQALRVDWAPLDRALPQRSVVAFLGAPAGHADDAALRAAHQIARDWAATAEVGSAYGPLAAGGDLLLAEALLEAGAELNAVLSAPAAAFADAAVRPADRLPSRLEQPWVARFDACLERASSVLVALSEPGASVHRHAVRQAMGLALLEADAMEAPCAAIVFGGGGTAPEALAAWRALGLPVTCLPLPWRDAPVPPNPEALWEAVVFADPGPVLDRAGTLPGVRHAAVFTGPARRRVTAMVMADLTAALGLAETLVDGGRPSTRLVCDVGLLPHEADRPHLQHLRGWRGAELLTEALPGCACATSAFAAEARLTLHGRVSLALTGRVGRPAPEGPPLPSVPLYRLGPGPSVRIAPEMQSPHR